MSTKMKNDQPKSDLIDWAVGQWWPELFVHQLDKARSRWWPGIEPQPMVPQQRTVCELEGLICDALVCWGAPHSEVAFAQVEPRHGVARTIVLWALHLVRGGESVILFIIMGAAIWWLPIFLAVLSTEVASVHELLLLALLQDCHLDGGHLIELVDQWLHNVFDHLE
jgi:hypothetical protein